MKMIKKNKNKHLIVFICLPMLLVMSLTGCNKNKTEPGPSAPLEYTITYAGVEDAINPNTITTYTADSGTITLLDPSKDGYEFAGWTFNGQEVTAIDTAWKQDITLVANWGSHNCHIELEWDLPEQFRFYFLGEPYATNFYVDGKNYSVAPKVHLRYGEDGDVYIPYINGISVHVDGFDSQTVGIKHVNIIVNNIFGPDGEPMYATKTFDIEVKDYDHNQYGYISQPQDVNAIFPDGYSLSATVKNEDAVISYNWMDTQEWSDPEKHAESCSQQTYFPYTYLRGSTALTNHLEVPSSFDTHVERFKLLTIYDDLTRIYSSVATATVDLPTSEERENYARLGDCVFSTDETRDGQPFDLSKNGLGSGTISFIKTANGADFTFTNVNFINNDYKCDAFNSATGFEYLYVKGISGESEPGEYYLHLVGDNYFTNTYYVYNASGFSINFQNLRQNARMGVINNSTLTIDGSGSLNLIGGMPALYANSDLIIDAKINTSSYGGRSSSGIEANDITLLAGATIKSTNKGTALLATLGNIIVNNGAILDLNLVTPRKEGSAASLFAVQANGDVRILSKNVLISISVTPEIYQIYDNQNEGVDSCTLVSAGRYVVLENGANVDLKVFASSSDNNIPIFGMIYGLTGDAGVYIEENATLNIDFQADLFYGIYAIAANNTLEIMDSSIDINMRCKNVMNGIYCETGNVGIVRSTVNILGHTTYVPETVMFGLFSGANSAIEIINSLLDINLNHGIAVASYFAWRNEPAKYDEAYTPKPKLLDGFVLDENKQTIGLYSVFALTDSDEVGFHILETIFDLPFNNTPATKVHVDNR